MTRSKRESGFEPFADDAAVRTLGALSFAPEALRLRAL